MLAGGQDNSLMSEINMTPFIDVMLVLLIIFMVTAPMMTQGLDVNLPTIVQSKPLAVETEEQLVVTIDKNQKIFINQYEVTLDLFREKLIKILEVRNSKDVFLKADKDVAYGFVVKIMADINTSGIAKLGIVTDSEEDKDDKNKDKDKQDSKKNKSKKT